MAAVQLLAMIEDAFGKQLPLSVLFQEATVDPGAPVWRAVRDYRPKRYPSPVTIFAGEGDRTAADWEGMADDIEVHTVPGDHDSFVEHLPAIAEQLRV